MFCCPECFSDDFLSQFIKRKKIGKGDCSFCGTKKTPIIYPSSLSDLFQPIIDLYVTSDGVEGKYLSEQIQDDWAIFKLPKRSTINSLISEIFKDKTLTRNKYIPARSQDQSKIIQWNEFREELKHSNRYFPKKFDVGQFDELFFNLHEESPKKLFRARINLEDRSYTCPEMSKPPSDETSGGRANPFGIPYLYASSDYKTAIAEVRPHKGDTVTVAEFKSVKDLNLADLRNPRYAISPFIVGEEDLKKLYELRPMLISFGEELSKPVLPREASLEYLPSQYLCEYFKHLGFNGVTFKSSLTTGDNYVIFNEKGYVRCKETTTYKVTSTDINTERL